MRFTPGLIAADHQWIGRGGTDQIAIFQRRAFLIQRVIHLGAGLDADDRCGTALNDRRVHAMAVQILRDIVAAVAGAQNQRFLATPGCATFKPVRVKHVAGEILQARQVRNMGDTVRSIREDQMPRTHHPLGPVRPPQPSGPAPGGRRHMQPPRTPCSSSNSFPSPPHTSPASTQHVLGNVFRPGRRKRHVGQVVDLDLVVQRQRVVARPANCRRSADIYRPPAYRSPIWPRRAATARPFCPPPTTRTVGSRSS